MVRQITREQRGELVESRKKEGTEDLLGKIIGTLGFRVPMSFKV